MSEIYQQAKIIAAYVGEEDQYAPNGLNTVIALARLGYFNSTKQAALPFNNPGLYSRAQAVPLTLADWRDWTIFLCREWFFRAWIIQEAALGGKHNVSLIYGQLCTQLDAVLQGLHFLFESRWNFPLSQVLKLQAQHDEGLQRYAGNFMLWAHFSHPSHWIRDC